jgi:hypothetical protein
VANDRLAKWHSDEPLRAGAPSRSFAVGLGTLVRQGHKIGWQAPDNAVHDSVAWDLLLKVLSNPLHLAVHGGNRKWRFLKGQTFDRLSDLDRRGPANTRVSPLFARQRRKAEIVIARHPSLGCPIRNPSPNRNLAQRSVLLQMRLQETKAMQREPANRFR